jgi:hypothetical protein
MGRSHPPSACRLSPLPPWNARPGDDVLNRVFIYYTKHDLLCSLRDGTAFAGDSASALGTSDVLTAEASEATLGRQRYAQ